MPYLVLRSELDAMKKPDGSGEAHITNIGEHVIDEDILPHGGIVLEEVIVPERTVYEQVSEPWVRPDGIPSARWVRRSKERKVLEELHYDQVIAKPKDKPEIRQKFTLYRCPATKQDALLLAQRPGWSAHWIDHAGQVPRIRRDVPNPDESKEPADPAKLELAELKEQAKGLMAQGAPPIKLSVSPAKLRAYVEEHGTVSAGRADSGGGETEAIE